MGEKLARGDKDNKSSQRVILLNRIVSHIRQSLDLQAILDTTVVEVRSFLKTDRVKIYQFDEAGNGQVIAESIYRDRLPSLLGLNFPAGDIPPQARELFCKAKTRSIVDIQQQKISLSEPSRLRSTATGELSVEEVRQDSLQNLLQRPVDPCHVEYLSLMGVKSSVVIPILNDKKLWGLLISHNAKSKVFAEVDLQLVEMIANQLEFAISQANLLSRVRRQAKNEAALNYVSNLLHSNSDRKEVMPLALQEIVNAVETCGGALLIPDAAEEGASFYVSGCVPQLSNSEWAKIFSFRSSQNRIETIDNLSQNSQLKSLQKAFRDRQLNGMLSLPIEYRQETLGHLTLFRKEIETEKLWAGYCDAKDDRQSRPRQSFEEWREISKGATKKWTLEELKLADAMATNLATSLMQDRLYHREKKQRQLVEMRNRELDKARAIAEQANSIKSNFLSSTSHELRTPLASTLNYLNLLKQGFYDNEQELREYIEAACISTENLVDIINDVLDISKIEAGRMLVELTPIQLQPMLEEQYSMFKHQSINSGVALNFHSEVDVVVADRTKLKQVLTNLLSNAFKFTHSGSISLEVSKEKTPEKAMVVFSVCDTGIGIESNKQNLVFEAFVQEEGSIRRRYGGTGLGLTICKKLVELMGGKIWLKSKGKNRGTTVSFTLPDRVA